MVKISQIIELMQRIAPEENTLPSYDDNVGLILGRADGETERVLCCLDATMEVIDEAIEVGASLIISHHPFIKTPPKHIRPTDPLGAKILRAAENRIAIYSAHTNLDIVRGGINEYIATVLGIKSGSIMEERVSGEGLGRVGELVTPLTITELAKRVADALDDRNVRVIARKDGLARRAAIINGGGGSNENIERAIQLGADCYITADVKYHSALYAVERGFAIIEPTHYAMERLFIKELVRILNEQARAKKLEIDFASAQSEKSPYIS